MKNSMLIPVAALALLLSGAALAKEAARHTATKPAAVAKQRTGAANTTAGGGAAPKKASGSTNAPDLHTAAHEAAQVQGTPANPRRVVESVSTKSAAKKATQTGDAPTPVSGSARKITKQTLAPGNLPGKTLVDIPVGSKGEAEEN